MKLKVIVGVVLFALVLGLIGFVWTNRSDVEKPPIEKPVLIDKAVDQPSPDAEEDDLLSEEDFSEELPEDSQLSEEDFSEEFPEDFEFPDEFSKEEFSDEEFPEEEDEPATNE